MMEAVGAYEASQGRLASLYARHIPEAIRLAYLLTGDRAAADDVAQEAFIACGGVWRMSRIEFLNAC
jgi:DNA-directed RNA polymerase specialized sigma24 family protein